jgi:hypothetical protein
MSVSELRQKIFTEIDKVITTGQPLEIVRKGHTLKIVLGEKKTKLSSLVTRDNVVTCSDDELIYNDYLKGWDNGNIND